MLILWVTQGLPRSFNKLYFDLIDEFLHIKFVLTLNIHKIPWIQKMTSIMDNFTCKSFHHMIILILTKKIIEDAPKRNASPLHLLIPYHIV
jgi:hypothetical protein